MKLAKRMMRPLLLLVVLSLLVAGCAGGGGTGSTGTGSPGGDAGTGSDSGVTGGTPGELRVAIQGDGETLDPARFSIIPDYAVITNIYNALVKYKTGTTELVPDLAEDWEISEDGLTYTFYLRKGVQWHKGYGEFTSADVKYSFERILDPETESRWRGELLDIESIETPDDYTVVINLKQPGVSFLHKVANFRQGFIVNEQAVKDAGDSYGRNPVGTGPYVFDHWTPGQEIVLTANPDYFEGKPPTEKIVFVPIAEETVRVLAFERGEIDIILGLTDPEAYKRFRDEGKVTVYEQVAPAIVGLRPNFKIAPFDNPKVREALQYAFDKEAIIDGLLGGMAVPAIGPIPPTMYGFTTDVPDYPYDPEKARAVLAEAGYPSGFDTAMYFANVGNNQSLFAALQSYLADIGVRAELKMLDGAAWFQVAGAGEPPLNWFPTNRAEPDVYLTSFFHSSNNPPGLNPYYDGADDLIEQQRTELDEAKRLELLAEIQRKIMEDGAIIPLYHATEVQVAQPWVEGFEPRLFNDGNMFGVTVRQR